MHATQASILQGCIHSFSDIQKTGNIGQIMWQHSSWLPAGRTLLNLDTEDWGEIFIGCAGGGDSLLHLPLQQESCSFKGLQPLELTVTGLMGGHSGLNIGEGRGNAICMAVQVIILGRNADHAGMPLEIWFLKMQVL